MIIGPVSIQWTTTVEQVETKRAKAKAVTVALIERLLHENAEARRILRSWGIEGEILRGGASKDPKPTRNPPRGRGQMIYSVPSDTYGF